MEDVGQCEEHSGLALKLPRRALLLHQPPFLWGGGETVRGGGWAKTPVHPAQTLAHHRVQLHTQHRLEATQQSLCPHQVRKGRVLQGPEARNWVGATELSQQRLP